MANQASPPPCALFAVPRPRPAPRRLLSLLLTLALVVAGMSPRPAVALPLVSVLTVNSGGDVNASDGVLTLREAILIANGGTAAQGLNRALSAGEMAQLSGCTFSGGLITGGCGAGLPDTIKYSLSITRTILNNTLPALNDDGTAILPTNTIELDFLAASGPATSAFSVFGDDIEIANLLIINLDSLLEGIALYGRRASIHDNVIGTRLGVAGCGTDNIKSRGDRGITIFAQVTSAADANYIFSNTIGCMLRDGIRLLGTDYTRIGVNKQGGAAGNRIGVSKSDEMPVPNGHSGIFIATTSNASGTVPVRYSVIANNTIAGNGGSGILAQGDGSSDPASVSMNTIAGNAIGYLPGQQGLLGNQGYGIRLTNGSYLNRIGGSAAIDANVITANISDGVRIDNSTNNGVMGNFIGSNGILTGSAGNHGYGVSIYGGQDNVIGGYPFLGLNVAGNGIGSNWLGGVLIDNSASNTVIDNDIGWVAGNGRANLGAGIRIRNGSGNLIGSYNGSNEGNRLYFNWDGGVIVDAAQGNTVLSNHVIFNAGPGIMLTGGAAQNTIGGPGLANIISQNSGDGILLMDVLDNTVHFNNIYYSGRHGVSLINGSTRNVVTSTVVMSNTLDGISADSISSTNVWSHLFARGNGGLGIDTNTTGDLGNDINVAPLFIGHTEYLGLATYITGKASPTLSGPFPTTTLVEVYALEAPADPTGYGEGFHYLGSTVTDASGEWQISVAGHHICVTAFQTRKVSGLAGTTTTSGEFALNRCVGTWLPAIRR